LALKKELKKILLVDVCSILLLNLGLVLNVEAVDMELVGIEVCFADQTVLNLFLGVKSSLKLQVLLTHPLERICKFLTIVNFLLFLFAWCPFLKEVRPIVLVICSCLDHLLND
jgi:hypothetical protein